MIQKQTSEERGHALISPSDSNRWINCPPAVRLTEHFPDSSSPFSVEGTAAHDLAEIDLMLWAKMISKKEYNKRLKEIKSRVYEGFGEEWDGKQVYSEEMPEEVSKYTDYVKELYAKVASESLDYKISIESEIDLGDFIPEGHGFNDAEIMGDDVLHVIDLKYGKGVEVSAVENSQLMIYALGAYAKSGKSFGVQEIHLHIIQPRINNFSTWGIKVVDLLNWAEKIVKPRAQLAYKGQGERSAGEWCRWCKIKARCKARADENLSLAKYEFKEYSLLSDEEIEDILLRVDEFKKWATDIEDHAYEEAMNGKIWPKFKLVEGRSIRKYSDEEEVLKTLVAQGMQQDKITETKLLAITKLEKAIGKKQVNDLVGDLIVKPAGKLKLVERSDKRKEINIETAEDDFAKFING